MSYFGLNEPFNDTQYGDDSGKCNYPNCAYAEKHNYCNGECEFLGQLDYCEKDN